MAVEPGVFEMRVGAAWELEERCGDVLGAFIPFHSCRTDTGPSGKTAPRTIAVCTRS
jgi:hypothetical protein